MLHFLVMADNRWPLRRYLRIWGEPLHGRVRLISYEKISDPAKLNDGAYVFSDIERLSPEGMAKARGIWDELSARGSRVRLYNSPHTVLRRRDLLRTLADNGSNHFRAYRLDEPREGIRYPVFLRSERQHTGPLSPLLPDADALERAIAGLVAGGRPASALLIVEFVDVSSNGVFHKYSVTRIGGTLLAQHAFFSRDWSVKSAKEWLPEYVRADIAFMDENPHRDRLEQLFRLANIDFGRADYAVHDGQIQLWEINTNPVFLMRKTFYGPDRLAAKLALAGRINAALAALDRPAGPPRITERLAAYLDLRR